MSRLVPKEELQEKRETILRRINFFSKKLEQIDIEIQEMDKLIATFKFKQGSVAFHATHGNVLIANMEIQGKRKRYVVVDKNGEFNSVSESELMQHGPATEVLYNK